MKTEWISIKDKLPEFQVKVLCFAPENSEMEILKLSEIKTTSTKEGINKDLTFIKSYADEYYYVVSHWMPLPELPLITNLNK